MPHPTGYDLPAPEHDQEFEVLCRDLMAAHRRPIGQPSLYGGRGQKQHGIDFVLQLEDGLHAYQCKRVVVLRERDVRREVEKIDKYKLIVKTYTILTTSKQDARLQDVVYALNEERRLGGLCPVSLVFWTTIRDLLVEYPDVLMKHYPEITPSLQIMLSSYWSRIEREHPGSRLELSNDHNGTNISVRPGPSGIGLTIYFRAAEIAERFRRGVESGSAVEFDDSEAEVRLPPVFTALFGLTMGPVKLSIVPSLNNQNFAVRIVVVHRSRFTNLEAFKRRAKKLANFVHGSVTILRSGTTENEMLVSAEVIPLTLRVRHWWSDVEVRGQAEVLREYAGHSIEAVQRAETLLAAMDGGAWMAVVGDDFEVAWECPVRDIPETELDLRQMLAWLSELADVTGVDFDLPTRLTLREIEVANRVVDEWSNGRRPFRSGERFSHIVRDREQLDDLRPYLMNGIDPWTLTFRYNRSVVHIFGVEFPIPARFIIMKGGCLAPETRTSIPNATSPFDVVFVGSEDGEITWGVEVDDSDIGRKE